MHKCYYNGFEHIMVEYANVQEFFDMQNELVDRFTTSFLTNSNGHVNLSDIPDNQSYYDLSYIKTAIIWSKVKYKNNSFLMLRESLSDIQEKQFSSFTTFFEKHPTCKLAFNKSGGYCMVTENDVTDVTDFNFEEETSHEINHGSKFLVLENDPKLEVDAIEFLKSVDVNYSYLTNLRSYNEKMLTNAISDFYGIGGKYIYVYTTASDLEQIEFYIQCALNAHLVWDSFMMIPKPIFIFEFSAGLTPRIKQFIHKLKHEGDIIISVKKESYNDNK